MRLSCHPAANRNSSQASNFRGTSIVCQPMQWPPLRGTTNIVAISVGGAVHRSPFWQLRQSSIPWWQQDRHLQKQCPCSLDLQAQGPTTSEISKLLRAGRCCDTVSCCSDANCGSFLPGRHRAVLLSGRSRLSQSSGR